MFGREGNADPGFIHDDGRWFTRKTGAEFLMRETGYATNPETMVSGEEWIPAMDTAEDAEALAKIVHPMGYQYAKIRLNVFRQRNINHNHIRLLKILISEAEKWQQKDKNSGQDG